MRHLGVKVLQCAFGADGREGKLDLDLLARFGLKVEMGLEFSATHLGEIVFLVKLTPETAVYLCLVVAAAVILDRFGEDHGKIEVVGPCPAAGDAVTGH